MDIRAKALLALTSASLIWGMNAFSNTLMLPYGAPITITGIRYLICSFALFIYFFATKKFRLLQLKQFAFVYMLGLLFVCGNSLLIFLGLQYSTVSHSSLINATSPLFIAVFSYFILKDHLLNIQWVGILVALISTLYILTNGNLQSLLELDFNKGDILFLLAQFGWTLYTILSPRILKEISILELVCWSSFFGGLSCIFIDVFSGTFVIPTPHPNLFIGLFYTAIMTSLLGISLWNFGVKHIGPSIAGIFINLTTIIGISSGILLLGDPFSLTLFLGAIGVFLGIFMLVQYRLIAKTFKIIDDMYGLNHMKEILHNRKERKKERHKK